MNTIVFFVLAIIIVCGVQAIVIQTDLGQWEGSESEYSYGFNGIPYALYPFFLFLFSFFFCKSSLFIFLLNLYIHLLLEIEDGVYLKLMKDYSPRVSREILLTQDLLVFKHLL